MVERTSSVKGVVFIGLPSVYSLTSLQSHDIAYIGCVIDRGWPKMDYPLPAAFPKLLILKAITLTFRSFFLSTRIYHLTCSHFNLWQVFFDPCQRK